ncbi:MAG: hypothetical protein ACLQF0_01350 [Dissulfurispiraceae bacterium]
MKTYKHRGKSYRADEPVPWVVALEVGGFYFSRAKYLGLPEPPAAFVFDDHDDDPEATVLIMQYHGMFSDAEASVFVRGWASKGGKIGGKAKSERKTKACRENASQPRPNRKPKKQTFNSIV